MKKLLIVMLSILLLTVSCQSRRNDNTFVFLLFAVLGLNQSNSSGGGGTGSSAAPTVTYSSSSYSFVKDTAITAITPELTATPLTSCVSSPSLPAGLAIDETTCEITGTPTAAQTSASYTITASNAYGTGTTAISIEVTESGTAPTVEYSGSPYSLSEDVAMTTITPALGGSTPDSCTSSPTLPDGLSIDSVSCAISGTPTTVQSETSYTITATNAYGSGTDTISISVVAVGSAPVVDYTGSPYSYTQNSAIPTLTPSLSGDAPASCTASPTLPTGLSIAATTCVITGTPTTAQSATIYTITASNAYGEGTDTISIEVTAAGTAPTVSYSGSPYSYTEDSAITTITPTLGGDTPTSCTASPGLPAGLSLNSTSCAISGTPTTAQSAASYTITASNAYGEGTDTISIEITTAGTAPTISYAGTPFTFTQNSAISTATATLGGSTPTGCSSSPSLPSGLSINATSCAISGTPTAAQSAASYTITATNAYGSGQATISITVTAAGTAPTVSYTASPYTFTQNSAITPISPTLGGDAPTSCTSSPSLPTGLSLAATTCVLSGTPTATQGAVSYTITATNAYGSGTDTISIEVDYPTLANTVSSVNSVNGSDWNDYFKSTGNVLLMADDDAAACLGTETGRYTACHHGGEKRKIEISEYTDCTGLTGKDTLNAFQWRCEEYGGSVWMVSFGLQKDKNLSDLIDFGAETDGPVSWKSIGFELYKDGVKTGKTEPAVWWSNPLMIENGGPLGEYVSLSDAGTIYIVNQDIGTDIATSFTIDADRVSLVVRPGKTVAGVTGTTAAGVSASSRKFLWIEGSFQATGSNKGISFSAVTYSVLRNVTVNNPSAGTTPTGIYLSSASNCNMLHNIIVKNATGYGTWITNSSENTLRSYTSASNGYSGIYITTAHNNVLNQLRVFNNGDNSNPPLNLNNSNNNVLTDLLISSAPATTGINLYNNSHNNVISGVTLTNVKTYGIRLAAVQNNTLIGYLTANTGDFGAKLLLDSGSANRLHNISGANGSGYGVWLLNTSDNTFSGILKLGSHIELNCAVTGGTNPGLDDTTCANNGTSSATLTTGITLADSFVGKASSDSVNSSHSSGKAAYPADPVVFDWTNFENSFRGWGVDGSAFPNSDTQAKWTAGTGRIWDWSLMDSDTIVRDVLSVPAGNQTITHTWSVGNITFLDNAIEILNDGIGNENGLCESSETCLYTPNIGAYQGHGDLENMSFTDGTVTGVTLKKFSINGR